MRGEAAVPTGDSIVQPLKTANQCYLDTCVNWPANMPGRPTGGCCLQWVDHLQWFEG